MLARGEFGDYASVRLVGCDLRSDDVRDDLFARAHHCRRGFVTRAFDAQNEGLCHTSMIFEVCACRRGFAYCRPHSMFRHLIPGTVVYYSANTPERRWSDDKF